MSSCDDSLWTVLLDNWYLVSIIEFSIIATSVTAGAVVMCYVYPIWWPTKQTQNAVDEESKKTKTQSKKTDGSTAQTSGVRRHDAVRNRSKSKKQSSGSTEKSNPGNRNISTLTVVTPTTGTI